MNDSIFVLFLGFSALWIALGIGGIWYLLKLDQKTLQVSKEGILVTISIVIPFIMALIIGWINF